MCRVQFIADYRYRNGLIHRGAIVNLPQDDAIVAVNAGYAVYYVV